jgi:hypothetical protein
MSHPRAFGDDQPHDIAGAGAQTMPRQDKRNRPKKQRAAVKAARSWDAAFGSER